MTHNNLEFESRIQANDHLLKAVVALLTIRDPSFVKQLDDVFMIARAQGNEIGNMDRDAWTQIKTELEIAREFALGDEEIEETAVLSGNDTSVNQAAA